MKVKSIAFIRLMIFLLLIAIVIIDTFIINHLQKKINQITIVTSDGDSLVAISPKALKKQTVLLTPKFVDEFSKYKSPFNDGLTFSELLEKYVHNSWSDLYGALRGSKKCRRVHEGIDLFVPENTPVYPLGDYGIVTDAEDNPHFMLTTKCKRENGESDTTEVEYGKIVRILYPEGIESLYAHLNEVYVKTGQTVSANTKVGLTGRTGNIRRSGKASHLHLELRDEQNRSFNPKHRLFFRRTSVKNFLKYLKFK